MIQEVENNNIKPTCIVVGSGRSGTSSVARILHNELGVYMGKFLKPGDDMNPEGYYEDLVSHALIRAMVAGDNSIYNPNYYLYIMNSLNSGQLAWGIKDPWVLYLNKEHLLGIKPKLCVVATRDLTGTLNSWLKLWKRNNKGVVTPPPAQVVEHYTSLTLDRQSRAEALCAVWPNIVTIDFSKQISDEEIASAIRYGLSSASFLK